MSSKSCKECGSWAINHNAHGRDGSDGDLCDVCYWRKRYNFLYDVIQKTLPALREYAIQNPKFKHNGVTQDPNGVHRILKTMMRMLTL